MLPIAVTACAWPWASSNSVNAGICTHCELPSLSDKLWNGERVPHTTECE